MRAALFFLALVLISSAQKLIPVVHKPEREVVKIECGNGEDTTISFTNLDDLYKNNLGVQFLFTDGDGKPLEETNCNTLEGDAKSGPITFNAAIGNCASSVTTTGSKPNRILEIQYSIVLVATPPSGDVYIIGSNKPIYQPKCSYELDRNTILNAGVSGIDRIDQVMDKHRDLNFVPVWQLYKDDQYTETPDHVQGDVSVKINDEVYSSIKMRYDLQNIDFNLQLLTCWASATPTSAYTSAEDGMVILIDKGCPKNGAAVTKTHEGKEARFSFKSFIFTEFAANQEGALNHLYLSCDVGFCIDTTTICPTPQCGNGGRRKRWTNEIEEPAATTYNKVVSFKVNIEPCEEGFVFSQDGKKCIREDTPEDTLVFRTDIPEEGENSNETIFSSLLILANLMLNVATVIYAMKIIKKKNADNKFTKIVDDEFKLKSSVLVDIPVETSATI